MVHTHESQQDLEQIKESSIDDVVDDSVPYLHPTILNSPVHDCVVVGNQAAIEMQESLTTSHKDDEQNETTFVTNGNNTQADSSVITNEHCEPDYKPPSQPVTNGSKYKPLISQDILFPMRDQKSLLEIKQVSMRGRGGLQYVLAYQYVIFHIATMFI